MVENLVQNTLAMHDALQLQYDSVIEIAFTSAVGKG